MLFKVVEHISQAGINICLYISLAQKETYESDFLALLPVLYYSACTLSSPARSTKSHSVCDVIENEVQIYLRLSYALYFDRQIS